MDKGLEYNSSPRRYESESEVAQSCPTLETPWTIAYQAPPSMGFSRQEYWSGVPYLILVCKYFLPFCRLPFHSVDCFLCCARIFQFDVVPFFVFVTCAFDIIYKKSLLIPLSWSFPLLSSWSIMVSGLTCRSVIYFELIFIYGIFIPFLLDTSFTSIICWRDYPFGHTQYL